MDEEIEAPVDGLEAVDVEDEHAADLGDASGKFCLIVTS